MAYKDTTVMGHLSAVQGGKGQQALLEGCPVTLHPRQQNVVVSHGLGPQTA